MENRISFKNDYSEGAHPAILSLLMDSNLNQEPGYGEDSLSKAAKDKIREALGKSEAEVFFVAGGTQANLLLISHLLKPYESVIAADTGHIEVHETGAIEYTGHKINLVKNGAGKITVQGIDDVVRLHTDHHMVKPKMVYLSQTTELGTVYKKQEIKEIAAYCRSNDLFLYVDGARLGVALTSPYNDLSLADLAELTDAFYIGATKNGGLLGEALVFNRPELAEGFSYTLKQRGALMAKGRLLGAQFLALFSDNLYYQLAEHANTQAMRLAKAFEAKGYAFASQPESNQLFPILPVQLIERLQQDFEFYIWEKRSPEEAVVRLVTSWATDPKDVEKCMLTL